MVGLTRHLRQVSDAQGLTPTAQCAEFAADHLGHGATDTGVDLVENHARGTGGLMRGGDLYREADARQFAAGGDLGNGLGWLAWISAHQEFDHIAARGIRCAVL